MLFTSFNYLLFFSLVIVLFNLIREKYRVSFLLIASYIFYISLQPAFALLLILITVLTYSFASFLSKTKLDKRKRRILRLGIVSLVLPLIFYKYFIPVNTFVNSLLLKYGIQTGIVDLSIILPIGISYYTFMAIGYLVDLYNEEVDFERNFVANGLFISFFPIVLSGPIERAGNLFVQFSQLKRSTYDDLITGTKIIIWGYFMKLCVADNLGIFIDNILNNYNSHNGFAVAFATMLYPFQIYGDLGGYSLLAIGSARCLGIKVIANFNRPFLSTSMSDFWRRWHISLIQWLTDYIYTPLSFSLRKWGIWGIVFALLLTFLISGIWHGATFTYVIWGLVQGVFLSIEALTKKKKNILLVKFNMEKNILYNILSGIFVFLLFTFSLLIVRGSSINDSVEVITRIYTANWHISEISLGSALIGLASLMILLLKDVIDEFIPSVKIRFLKFKIINSLSIWVMILYILTFGALNNSQFIYFQF